MKRLVAMLCLVFTMVFANAQEKWNLEQLVAYAVSHNISVKQADVQARLAAATVQLNEAGKYPSASFGSSAGVNFGRSINPTTNQFSNNRVFFNNYQLQSNVNLFNWFSQRFSIEASKLEKKAADAAVDKTRNDIALNVCIAYLQALLANEQVETASIQIAQTSGQLDVVQKRVNAGALPELNLVEVQAQQARDSAAYIGAVSVYQQNLIQLKALLAMDMAQPFDIEKPDVSAIPVQSLSTLQPFYVYGEALKNLPQQRVNQYRYDAAKKAISAARAAMYPTLSAFLMVGSTYSDHYPDETRAIISPQPGFTQVSGLLVETSPGNFQPVVAPNRKVTVPNASYTQQVFNFLLGQRVGVNLSVPIFQNRQLKTGYERARLNAESIRFQLDQDNLNLQADIYNAYTNAVNAQQRYLSAEKASFASGKALEYSKKRFDAGLLPIFELITNQNNYNRAVVDSVSARYEFVFRMKLLEFYKGQGLQL